MRSLTRFMNGSISETTEFGRYERNAMTRKQARYVIKHSIEPFDLFGQVKKRRRIPMAILWYAVEVLGGLRKVRKP